jgi:hypothetical protein
LQVVTGGKEDGAEIFVERNRGVEKRSDVCRESVTGQRIVRNRELEW